MSDQRKRDKPIDLDVTKDRDLNTDGLKNRAKGTVEELKGKARNAWGAVTGDTSEQLKGKAEELRGKAQKGIGRAQQHLDDALDHKDHKAP
jgi:uncharacterized protein YjbJ (UPF0337 family)